MDKPDAQQTDPQTHEETGEVVGNAQTRRTMIDEISARVDADRAAEFGETPVTPAEAESDQTELAPAAEPTPAQAAAGSAAPAATPEPRKFTLKVNGQDIELTEDEVLARARKVSAADQYLQEAARIRNAMLAAAQAQQQPQPNQQPADASDAASASDDEAALARALQTGSEDEAKAAVGKIVARAVAEAKKAVPAQQQAPSLTLEAIDPLLDLRETKRWFETDYADIVGDPDLRIAAFQRDAHLVAQGDARHPRERWKEIGDALRSRFVAPKTQTFEAKQEAKAAVAQPLPQASAKAAPAKPQDTEDDTPSAVIAKIANSRGQRITA